MITYNVLYNATQIASKVQECAVFIDSTPQSVVLCPIQQSSFMFASDVAKQLRTDVSMDFCGVNRYADDGTEDELYMYKGIDPKVLDNKNVVVLDVLCNTGTTLDFTARLLKQMGAAKVYTVCLVWRQF